MLNTSSSPRQLSLHAPTKARRAQGVLPADIRSSVENIGEYVKPYQECVTRSEQAGHLRQMIEGMTSNLERKSIEPIAVMHDVPRRGLQRFVGERGWDYRLLREQQRREVVSEIGMEDAAIVVDGSSTPKKGLKPSE